MLTVGVTVSGGTIAIEIYEWENICQLRQEVEMRAFPHAVVAYSSATRSSWTGVEDRAFSMIPATPNERERGTC